MKAFLKNYRQSPRKVRLVAGLIRGMDVQKALTVLTFSDKKSSHAIKKLLHSALANAVQRGDEASQLFIKDIHVDQGISMRRMRPRAFGRAAPFRRRTSSIRLFLAKKARSTEGKKS